MRRELPARASLEHLKKQAKDLKDAHGRREPEAAHRIRSALPALAGRTDEAVWSAPFALHDAQSVVAREYGEASWKELRDAVAAQAEVPSDALLRALMPVPFPGEVGALLQEASTRRAAALAAAEGPAPTILPLLALRNALLLPRALAPIHVSRAASRAAIELARAGDPPTLATFAQREADVDAPDVAGLHGVGCEVLVHGVHADGPDRLWVVLEGLRWVTIDAIEAGVTGAGGALLARVRLTDLDRGDPAEADRQAASLRAHARGLAGAFPDGERLVRLLDAAPPERLADLVVANLPVPVADKARYASEPRLLERLRIASALAGLP